MRQGETTLERSPHLGAAVTIATGSKTVPWATHTAVHACGPSQGQEQQSRTGRPWTRKPVGRGRTRSDDARTSLDQIPLTTAVPPLQCVTRRVTIAGMTPSFRDRDTESLAARQRVKQWSPELSKAALRKLRMLDAAEELSDLRVPPGNRLERLKGGRQGQHSIRINDQWRICFRWEASNAYNVEILDEH